MVIESNISFYQFDIWFWFDQYKECSIIFHLWQHCLKSQLKWKLNFLTNLFEKTIGHFIFLRFNLPLKGTMFKWKKQNCSPCLLHLHLPAIMLFWGQYKKAVFYQFDNYNENNIQHIVFKDVNCFKVDNTSPTCPIYHHSNIMVPRWCTPMTFGDTLSLTIVPPWGDWSGSTAIGWI